MIDGELLKRLMFRVRVLRQTDDAESLGAVSCSVGDVLEPGSFAAGPSGLRTAPTWR